MFNSRMQRSVGLFGAVFLTVLAGCQTVRCTEDSQDHVCPQVNEEEVTMLREIVSLREATLKELRLMAELGLNKGLAQGEVELANSRIHLADAQHKTELVVQLLQDLVTVLQETVKRQESIASSGRITLRDLRETQIALAEARLRLLQEERILSVTTYKIPKRRYPRARRNNRLFLPAHAASVPAEGVPRKSVLTESRNPNATKEARS